MIKKAKPIIEQVKLLGGHHAIIMYEELLSPPPGTGTYGVEATLALPASPEKIGGRQQLHPDLQYPNVKVLGQLLTSTWGFPSATHVGVSKIYPANAEQTALDIYNLARKEMINEAKKIRFLSKEHVKYEERVEHFRRNSPFEYE